MYCTGVPLVLHWYYTSAMLVLYCSDAALVLFIALLTERSMKTHRSASPGGLRLPEVGPDMWPSSGQLGGLWADAGHNSHW